jgi:TonB family protein
MGSVAHLVSSATGMGRRLPRCPIAVPVRVTVVRAGVPNAIAGRSLDLSERGIAAILAGEVSPGDPVAVEFLLPEMGLGLHAKATVRHHAPLRSGLEFQTLSVEQRAMIRRWTHRVLGPEASPASVARENPFKAWLQKQGKLRFLNVLRSRRFLTTLGIGILCLLLFSWWEWQSGWRELETEAAAQPVGAKPQRLTLSPGVMEPLLLHKELPELPTGAKAGAALVRVVIGREGLVIDQHPVSGPPVMQRAAMDAVRSWRFQPYRVEGVPVEVETTVAVEFQDASPDAK